MLQSGVKRRTFEANLCNGIVYFESLIFELLFVL